MNIKKMVCIIFLIGHAWQNSAQAQAPPTVTIGCPTAEELQQRPSAEGTLHYATVYINLPALHDQLYLSGNASSPKAHYFFGANWMDQSFLCLYDFDQDAIVIFETVLYRYVDRCYFVNGTDAPRDECNAPSPDTCRLTCVLNSSIN